MIRKLEANKKMFESDEYSDYGSQAYKVLRTLREYLNSKLRYESINNIEFRVGDIYEAQSGNAFAFEVYIQDPEIYTRESYIKIVSSNELYSRDIFLYKYGFDTNNYIEISRFGAGDKLLNIIKDIAESIPDYDGKASVYATRESIVKPNRKRPIRESTYVDYDNVDDMYEEARKYLGTDTLLFAIVEHLDIDTFVDVMGQVAEDYDIEI